ncbi:MAG TPA: RodZ domain-containing protein, partial [Halomonas sp.]|nr:RodZ domain-containing protein [Halomonas sp.]
DEVPVAIYRRGYLRSYASLLGLDPEPVIAAYRARNADEASEPPTQPLHLHKPPSRIGAWLFRLVTLAVIVGLAGLTLMWWQSRGGNQPPDPGTSEPVAVDSRNGTITLGDAAPSQEAPADSGTGELPPATPLPETPIPETPMAETGQAVTAPADRAVEAEPALAAGASGETADGDDGATAVALNADQEGASDAAANAQASANRLHLVFNEQSWTEIIDANGDRILVGLQQPGTEASVEGEPPLRMTIGNATGVEMTWRGETENVGGRAQANNVARFTLGE